MFMGFSDLVVFVQLAPEQGSGHLRESPIAELLLQ
jgi:hypothetical protein